MNRKTAIILGVVIVVLIVGVALAVHYGTRSDGSPQYSEPGEQEFARIDCYPEEKWANAQVTAEMCRTRGCVFSKFDSGPDVYVPSCYMDQNRGYTAARGSSALGDKWILRPGQNMDGPARIQEVAFEVFYPSENVLRFKFSDNKNVRYEVPSDILEMNVPQEDIRNDPSRELKFSVEVSVTEPFSFRVVRSTTGTVLWDTSVGGLDLQEQFLSISTKLPSQNVYGFGENSHESFRHDMNFRTWGMFARDQWVGTGVHNHYGVHPFYTCLEEDGNSHGVFLLNSNAMDYTMSPLPMLTYRTIGGILDFYVFLGPTPENVVQQYTEAIGRPYMPPYWALGFQLCRYGYNSLTRLQEAVNRTLNANIPLDVQYADIDHYDVRKVFTIDEVAFAGLPEYFEYLRDSGMHTIIILDPCLITNETDPVYPPYELGKAARAFIEWPSEEMVTDPESADGEHLAMLGFVWPQGKVVFPDFFKPQTETMWENLIVEHFDKIKFDGLWIDMNEPANFGTNDERPWNWPEDAKPYWSLQCPDNVLEDPPYRTMAAYGYDGDGRQARLSDKTLCMVARQGVDRQYTHYDVHNLYGPSQIKSTLNGLRRALGNQTRGIVVGRSTFPGGGHQSGHWLGDNFSTWKQMKESIIGMMEFNLFGFPYIGADICGFFAETNAELCKRWMQLGAFYPYSRNHNQADNKIDQDPANFNEEVTALSRDALEIRYTLLPYLYTLFHEAHTKGNTVVRPLLHEFPTDSATWGLDEQFMWGQGLMIVPILSTNSMMNYYLPKATWYDHYTDQPVQWSNEDGGWHRFDIFSDSKIPLFYKGGSIIPTQEHANNTHYSRQKPFHLKVYLDRRDSEGGQASGHLFWDDGDSIDTYETGNYYLASYSFSLGQLMVDIQNNNVPEMSSLLLESVSIVGVNNTPSAVTVGGVSYADFTYTWPTLTVTKLNIPMDTSFSITYSCGESMDPGTADWIDCYPDWGTDRATCEARGCIWSVIAPTNGAPRCYMNISDSGYTMSQDLGGQSYDLTKIGSSSMFGGDLPQIKVAFVQQMNNILRIKIYSEGRYEVPIDMNSGPQIGEQDYEVIHPTDPSSGEGFYIQIKRKSTGTVIWDTSIGGLVFADMFLQLVTRVPTTKVYGFGENRHFSYRQDFTYKTWPMFSRDQAPGWGDYGNLYGVHPYYMCLEDTDGHAHGVLLLNSNAMEVVMTPAPAITYRTVGGILDFYIILGDTPEQVTQGYTALIGRPYLPAYWTLGFQLCRYGYENIANMKAAVDRTIAASIPYDVQYGDIDHFVDSKIFTWDPVRFPGLPEYFDELRAQGIKTIIILDPFVLAVDPLYEPFTKAGDIFIKWPAGSTHPDITKFNSTDMHGYVWPPGPAVFPDFLKAEGHNWWKQCIADYHANELKFDGLWIDMNEPANFGTNEEKPWNWPEDSTEESWSLKCPNSDLDDPPYKPRSVFGGRLSDKTICMVGVQQDMRGGETTQYNMHSLYGWSNTIPTLQALQEVTGERGVVISRSTYPSSGTMAGHWLGDNDSSWAHMRDSVIGIMEFSIFGVPYIGADICGYFGNTTAQLCQRWMQLGAFYTFSRNHNGRNYMDQDPAALGTEVAESSRKVLEIRYTLLPYLYTLFYEAHATGATVIRPLLHEFYADEMTYGIDRQFLWGPALLISPVLDEDALTVEAYFPSARWFSYHTGEELSSGDGMFHTLDAPLDFIPLHVRGGYILATQQHANNTMHSRDKPMGLIIAPGVDGTATGNLFWDDGVSIDSVSGQKFHYLRYTLANAIISMNITERTALELPLLSTIRLFGIDTEPTTIRISQNGSTRDVLEDNIVYHPGTKVLLLKDLEISQGALTSEWQISLSQ